LCKTNVGLVFTNENLKLVRDLLLDNRVEAPARSGALAPCDVVVPAGPTGLEPTMTSFFQALSVPTKINKGSIEILSDVELIKKGDKCGPSEVALLSKLNIRPFSYGLSVETIWDNGSIYSPSALDISENDVIEVVQHALQQVAAFSLQTGYLTSPAVPHLLVNGFKNLLSVAVATEYSFPQAEKIKEAIKNPQAFAAAAPAAAAPAAAGAKGGKAKEPEPEPEEEDNDMGFSLFD
jgi:large subunit ribosomal protein LP0